VDLSVLRSVLFAPASDERKLGRALASDADAVIADLEDGTAPGEKEAARGVVETLFAGVRSRGARAVRVNAPGTEWFDGDLELAGRLELDFLMLPKATPSSVAALGGSGPPVVALVETADGLRLAYETASAERVVALALGTHDLAAELRTTPRPDGLDVLYARSKLVVDSAAAGRRPPIDTPYLDVRDPLGLEEECRLARTLGLRGKLCIHPGQLDIVNRVFAPSEEEVDWARRVVQAYEHGVHGGRGAVALDGRMVDLAVARRAEQLLAEARSRDEHRPAE
jgi:citrate lyase beta subunit